MSDLSQTAQSPAPERVRNSHKPKMQKCFLHFLIRKVAVRTERCSWAAESLLLSCTHAEVVFQASGSIKGSPA